MVTRKSVKNKIKNKLKNWKKIGEYKKSVSWRSKKSDKLVSVSPTDYKGGFDFSVNHKPKLKRVSYDKAKKGAIKYMKKTSK